MDHHWWSHNMAQMTKVGVVMTFVWMNYGRMVGDSTLQTVNTTGLILQVRPWTKPELCFAYLCYVFVLHVIECLQGIYVFSFYSITSHKLQAGKKIFLTILLLFIIGMYIITAEVRFNAKWANPNSVVEGSWGDNPEHWLAGSNHVICLLLCPTCQYSRGGLLSLLKLFVVFFLEKVKCSTFPKENNRGSTSGQSVADPNSHKLVSSIYFSFTVFLQVCRNRSTRSLPFYLILSTCVVTGLWTIYGSLRILWYSMYWCIA